MSIPEVGEEAGAEPQVRVKSTRIRWVLMSVVVVVTATLGGIFAYGLSRDPRAAGSPVVGRKAPEFDLPELDGSGRVRLSSFRRQVVVINFWASWCAACREEHPNLVAAWERYRDRGVVFVGIDYQDSPAAARKYMSEMGGDWPVVTDPSSRAALAYGVYGVPETFFIGRDGVVAHVQVGASSYELLTSQIERLLSDTGRP